MISIEVKLDSFEGPIDLLYKLIEKNKIDIYDIPIVELADQYMCHIESFPNDIDSISEFLLMASTLLEIKSRMLLSKKDELENTEDPREELVSKLVEYKMFKEASYKLRERISLYSNILYKLPEKCVLQSSMKEKILDYENVFDGIASEILFTTFQRIMNYKEIHTKKLEKIRSSFNSLKIDEFKVEDKIKDIFYIISKEKKINLKSIFKNYTSKIEKVVTFLAILELIKIQNIRVKQKFIFDDIILIKY